MLVYTCCFIYGLTNHVNFVELSQIIWENDLFVSYWAGT